MDKPFGYEPNIGGSNPSGCAMGRYPSGLRGEAATLVSREFESHSTLQNIIARYFYETTNGKKETA